MSNLLIADKKTEQNLEVKQEEKASDRKKEK